MSPASPPDAPASLAPLWEKGRGRARVEALCPGGPYEMGFAQGSALRVKILAAREALSQLEVFRLLQPPWLPYLAYRRLSERRVWRRLSAALAQDHPETLDRLRGIADGARLGVEAMALMNACEAFMSSMGGRFELPSPGACSAAALRGSRSASGEPVLVRNFDYLPLAQPFFVLRECRPAGGLRSLDFTAAPLAGAVDGVNERGLCVAYNYAYTAEAAPPAATITMAISEALERFGTVAEAAEWIASRPRWGGGLLMLADASGDIASLELSAARWGIRRPAPGEDLLIHTNAFHLQRTREVEVPRHAVFSARAPAALRGKRVLESAERRYERLKELLGGGGALGPEELARLMSDHGPEGVPGGNTVCVHSAYWTTTACLQLFPRSRKMRVDYANACRAHYDEFGL